LIVDIDRLTQEEEYGRGPENMFGVSGLVDRNHTMWCSAHSKKANRLNPRIIADETLADLYKYNDLTVCPDGIRFSDQVLSDLVKFISGDSKD
jgi:hypothetical protein